MKPEETTNIAQCRRCGWYVKRWTLTDRGVCMGPLGCRRDKWFDYRFDVLAAKGFACFP